MSLTQGGRPDDLARGLTSLLAQTDVALDIVVVDNGGDAAAVDALVAALPVPEGGTRPRVIHLPENVGIPAGRNAGTAHVAGEFVFFLDDDASLPSPRFLADAVDLIRADPSIGLIQPRVVDPSGASNPTRWIPRLRKGSPSQSSDVFSVWEGATLMPRALFDAIDGWGAPYWYAHEGIELAWRVWGEGSRTRYEGMLVAHHPAISPARHAEYWRLNARNRVWLAKRNLPWLLAPVYVGSWTLVQLVRALRSSETRAGLGAWWGGWVDGWRTSPGGRRSVGWRGVARMTRAGRLPIL